MSYTMAINNSQLSGIMQKLIEVHEITAAELARRVNLPQPTIQRIVAGVYKNPRISTLQPIADYFGITINQLRGLDAISFLPSTKKAIKHIPLISAEQLKAWPIPEKEITQFLVCDNNLGEKSFAMPMPDRSMEPVMPKDSVLIVDPSRTPQYGSYIVVKLENCPEVIVRQLITDATTRFIKPLSPELNQLKMNQLTESDRIRGVIVEVRLNCEA